LLPYDRTPRWIFWKLALTRTPDPNRPARLGPDPNRLMYGSKKALWRRGWVLLWVGYGQAQQVALANRLDIHYKAHPPTMTNHPTGSPSRRPNTEKSCLILLVTTALNTVITGQYTSSVISLYTAHRTNISSIYYYYYNCAVSQRGCAMLPTGQ